MAGADERSMEASLLRNLDDLILRQQAAQIPNREVLFRCAQGLQNLRQYVRAGKLLRSLAEDGFQVTQCRYKAAECALNSGNIVQARRDLEIALANDPTDASMLAFRDRLDRTVAREGKIMLGIVVAAVAAVGMFIAYYRRGQGVTDVSAERAFLPSST